ncbi:MAG: hypothetical protein H7Z14_14305 [Anaerolineae bacterium]|nr:hypothetical protein [Phycisphaerae bacterium]
MIRILHLHDRPADYQTGASIDALRADASGQFTSEIRAIGRGSDHSTALAAVLAMRRSNQPRSDMTHAWGPKALRVAVFGGCERIIYSPSHDPHHREIGWLRSIMNYRDVNVVCPTDTVRRRLVEHGVPIGRTHLIRPAVAFGKVRRRRNDALRAELGIKPDDRVTLAPGESTRPADHEMSVFAVTLLTVLDPRNKLLVWGRGPHSAALRRFAKKLDRPTLIDATHTLRRPIDFPDLLSVADDVLITATGSIATLPACYCMAAGLPIVTLVSETIAELLEDRHTALMVGKRSPRLLAQRLLDVRADANLQWAISDMARTEAYEFFSMSRFLDQHRAMYQQVAEGKSVEVVQKAPGAGLRFHGRV